MLVTEEAKEALKGSIDKWQKIVIAIKNGDLYDERGRVDCPLCQKYNPAEETVADRCFGCPIRNDTGCVGCQQTPYGAWSDVDDGGESEDNAQAMLNYLVHLDKRCEVPV